MEPHKLDQLWIRQQLNSLPIIERKRAIEGYKQVFKEAYDAEPIDHMKSNAARRAANTRLREFIKRINGTFSQ